MAEDKVYTVETGYQEECRIIHAGIGLTKALRFVSEWIKQSDYKFSYGLRYKHTPAKWRHTAKWYWEAPYYQYIRIREWK